jgi:hypothetical protein
MVEKKRQKSNLTFLCNGDILHWTFIDLSSLQPHSDFPSWFDKFLPVMHIRL